MEEGIDWKSMFKRYLNDVGEAEGVYFIDEASYTLEENTAIDQLIEEIHAEQVK